MKGKDESSHCWFSPQIAAVPGARAQARPGHVQVRSPASQESSWACPSDGRSLRSQILTQPSDSGSLALHNCASPCVLLLQNHLDYILTKLPPSLLLDRPSLALLIRVACYHSQFKSWSILSVCCCFSFLLCRYPLTVTTGKRI